MAGSGSASGSKGGGGRGRKRSTTSPRKRSGNGRASASSASGSGSGSGSGASSRSDAGADGKLYYRIGEVAKLTGVKPHVLRYWETEFRWMAPPKSRSKQRLYRRKDIEMIKVIKRLLYDERYTIAGARQQLRELGLAKALETASDTTPAASAAPPDTEAVEAVAPDPAVAMAELRSGYRRIRKELEAIRELI